MAAKEGQYLTFYLKQQYYAVPIESVREINQVLDITPVPQAPEYVVGVINLRGKVIPVVDLRMRLNMPSQDHSKETCIIVVDGPDGAQVGVIVDSVSDVVHLGQEQIEPSPRVGDSSQNGYIMGVGKQDNRVLILVDIQKTVSVNDLPGLTEDPSGSSIPQAA